LLEAPVLAFICSLLTRYAPPEGYTVMDNKNLVSYFFMSVIVATFIGMSGSAEEIIKDRALLKREKFLHLSYSSYIWSKIVFTAGMSLIQTLLFILVGNFIMGLHGLFFVWWLILFVTALLSNLIGLLLSKTLNSVVAIYISIPLLLIPQILLCGLVVDFSDLTPNSKTGNVPVIGDVIPSRWAYEALAVTSFTDNLYEKPFFELDKQKYETLYYNMGFLYELE
jgi:ABC-type multidrug transport system permease subunit